MVGLHRFSGSTPAMKLACLRSLCFFALTLVLSETIAVVPLAARGKSPQESYGMGLSVNVPVPENELLQAVQEVVADGIIQGSKEYNKDEYIAGADAADESPVFPKWSGPGKAFYKVRLNALDPRNFKDTTDAGTLAVRYVVQPGEKGAILKIDAVFVDDVHHRAHPSNGSVEGAEYAAIQSHLAAMHLEKQRAAENEERKQRDDAARELQDKRKDAAAAREKESAEAISQAPGEGLDEHVRKLRRQVERVVKPAGARLRSVPFQSASSLQSLPSGSQVVILVSTRYWFGVETEGGQHGWIHRSQLEPLP